MRYYKITSGDHILLVGIGKGGVEITAQEYIQIKNVIANRPDAPDGYGYRLTDDLMWEMYQPPESDPVDDEATEADYQDALKDMGVNLA